MTTIPSRLLDNANTLRTKPAHYTRTTGGWVPTSWQQYSANVTRVGRALIALGVEPEQCTCLLGFNRAEWVEFHVASMGIGAAPAGIYATCSSEEVAYILRHSEAPVALVENAEQLRKVQAERGSLPHLKTIVLMRGAQANDDASVLGWEQFIALADRVPEARYFDRLHALQPSGTASLIYTSGTTGPPKGVMLSHRNLTFTSDASSLIVDSTDSDTLLSYLPLSHIAEQMFTIHTAISAKYAVYFAESIERVPENLKEVQPTIFFGVPRIWEKFYEGISNKTSQATGLKKQLFATAQAVGRHANVPRHGKLGEGKSSGLPYAIANRVVYSKIKEALGLKNARYCVSGAAPIAREVLEFFASIGIVILEVYGQSEDCGPTTASYPDRYKFGSVGTYIPGVDVKLASDGEILVRGDNVFKGYFKDPEATAEALDSEGWLHSGDLGSIDAHGFLSITGRKKEIIITAGGKNVAPKNIESALKAHEYIDEAVVIGDRRKYLTALVSISPQAVENWARAHNSDSSELLKSDALREELDKHVAEINKKLARVEQIKRYSILPRPLSVQDGELTPTLKVKRNVVNNHFSELIELMYSDDASDGDSRAYAQQ